GEMCPGGGRWARAPRAPPAPGPPAAATYLDPEPSTPYMLVIAPIVPHLPRPSRRARPLTEGAYRVERRRACSRELIAGGSEPSQGSEVNQSASSSERAGSGSRLASRCAGWGRAPETRARAG